MAQEAVSLQLLVDLQDELVSPNMAYTYGPTLWRPIEQLL